MSEPRDYWIEAATAALEEAGIEGVSREQIVAMASVIEGSAENESTYRGWDVIPTPPSPGELDERARHQSTKSDLRASEKRIKDLETLVNDMRREIRRLRDELEKALRDIA